MLEGVLDEFTYAGIFVVLFLGSIGLPVPEEAPLLAAGILSHQGVIHWEIALVVCLAGVLAGDTALYWGGRHWGNRLLDWPPVRRILSSDRREKLEAEFRRRGAWMIFAARYVMGLRAAAMLTAGIARLPYWKFIAVDAVAAVFGLPLSFGLGYLFADHVEDLVADIHRIERWLGLLALLGVSGWLARLLWRRRRRALAA
jgi:membrane protein DedA with SNARE-associated domain